MGSTLRLSGALLGLGVLIYSPSVPAEEITAEVVNLTIDSVVTNEIVCGATKAIFVRNTGPTRQNLNVADFGLKSSNQDVQLTHIRKSVFTPEGSLTPKVVYQLYGDIQADTKYTLRISDLETPISVVPMKDVVRGVEVQPLVGDSSGTVGVKFNASYDSKCFFGRSETGFSSAVTASGEVSADDGDSDFDQTLKTEVEFKYFPEAMRFGKSAAGRGYYSGFRIAPAGIEADQDFDIVNYTGKVEFATEIPFTDDLIGPVTTGPGSAAMLLTGYTFAGELRDEGEAEDDFDPTNRWDTEFVWAFTLPGSFTAELRWKAFYDLEETEFEERFLGSLRYPLDDDATTNLVLSYRDGGDAPTFKDDKAFRVGFDIGLGSIAGLLGQVE